MSNYPSDLKYSKEHGYIRLEGNIATCGVTQFAANQLGEIVFADVPTVGKKLDAEEEFGTIEAVKGVNSLFMPVTGMIEAVNAELDGSPELINDDPYGEGWIVKIKVDDTSSVQNLLSASQYEEFLKQQE